MTGGSKAPNGGLNLAMIGNCTFAALIDERARFVWTCLPRFDGDPVFSALVDRDRADQTGFYEVELIDCDRHVQRYRPNTAIVETELSDRHGGVIKITDFAPRFKNFERTFRPIMLVRQVEVLAGNPKINVRLRPNFEYGATQPKITRGSNHLRYVGPEFTLRLTTDCPISYVEKEIPFVLEHTITLVLGTDESVTQSIADMSRDFREQTEYYWREWCRFLAIPFEWQDAVIRAAITLKLSNFEDTGAIVAAVTTSIPEAPASGRNWDYRYCWLRDSFFVVRALNDLGVTRTMQGYLSYIRNLISSTEDGYLQPVFGILGETSLKESTLDTLSGYDGNGYVRIGNEAYTQVQNDSYGSVILASAQSFFDQRMNGMGNIQFYETLEKLGEQATQRWDKPDAGLWEYRTRENVHTFSSVMCWAACDRLAKIATKLELADKSKYWAEHALKIHAGIMARAWNSNLNAFTNNFDGEDADASLLLLPQLGFIDGASDEFLGTLAFVEAHLKEGNYLYRYSTADDFGTPETSFNVCTFWYIDGLVAAGRREEARELFEHMLDHRNPVGLLSEDVDPKTGELWGNFPQTYSMVGIIHCAKRLSEPWEDAF